MVAWKSEQTIFPVKKMESTNKRIRTQIPWLTDRQTFFSNIFFSSDFPDQKMHCARDIERCCDGKGKDFFLSCPAEIGQRIEKRQSKVSDQPQTVGGSKNFGFSLYSSKGLNNFKELLLTHYCVLTYKRSDVAFLSLAFFPLVSSLFEAFSLALSLSHHDGIFPKLSLWLRMPFFVGPAAQATK